jgi:hypothetical protein
MGDFVGDYLVEKLIRIGIQKNSVDAYPVLIFSEAEHCCFTTSEVEQNITNPEFCTVVLSGALDALPNTCNRGFYVIQRQVSMWYVAILRCQLSAASRNIGRIFLFAFLTASKLPNEIPAVLSLVSNDRVVNLFSSVTTLRRVWYVVQKSPDLPTDPRNSV